MEKANCVFQFYNIDGVPRAFIVTLKNILKGEVFYTYYGQDYDEVAKTFCFFENVNDQIILQQNEIKAVEVDLLIGECNINQTVISGDENSMEVFFSKNEMPRIYCEPCK